MKLWVVSFLVTAVLVPTGAVRNAHVVEEDALSPVSRRTEQIDRALKGNKDEGVLSREYDGEYLKLAKDYIARAQAAKEKLDDENKAFKEKLNDLQKDEAELQEKENEQLEDIEKQDKEIKEIVEDIRSLRSDESKKAKKKLDKARKKLDELIEEKIEMEEELAEVRGALKQVVDTISTMWFRRP